MHVADTLVRTKVLAYLRKGTLVLGRMGFIPDDKTKEFMANDSYYTDSEWVWSEYLIYYVEKLPTFKLDEEFVGHLVLNDFQLKDMTQGI